MIVGIGGSAGGSDAFRPLLDALPPDTGLAFVVVSHVAPGSVQPRTRDTALPVIDVDAEAEVLANHVYVIPPGKAMIIRNGRLRLLADAGAALHAVDTFFSALASDQGHRACGVMLPRAAGEGTLGLRAIKAAGGITFLQDVNAPYDGTPTDAHDSGCADFVLPPAEIAAELARLARHPYLTEPAESEGAAEEAAERIFDHLRRVTGADLAEYEPGTLHRRMRRRMALNTCGTLRAYAALLAAQPREVEALYQDLLLSGTGFFGNADALAALKAQVLPQLLANRAHTEPLRVWVLGSSTGEEAYSLAILLAEHLAETRTTAPVLLYATDIDHAAIERARSGLYPKRIARHISAERLRRFFVATEDGYRVARSIRDMCIFARQNVLTDPPFSRIDLISCRNLLICVPEALKRKLLHTVHYALNPHGVLLLGPSETAGADSELFEPLDTAQRIFSRRSAASRPEPSAAFIAAQGPERAGERRVEALREPSSDIRREAERVLLTRYVPAGVLVNPQLEVVQFRGETGAYLAPAPAQASLSILKLAREGLTLTLRQLLQRAREEDGVVSDSGVRLRSNGGLRTLTVSVVPVRRNVTEEPWYWVLFEETPGAAEGPAAEGPAAHARASPARTRGRGVQRRSLRDREEEISRLSQQPDVAQYLHTALAQEAANEELHSLSDQVHASDTAVAGSDGELATKLLEQAHEAIFAYELDGTIRYWNRGAARLYGYTPEEAIGRSVFELLWAEPQRRSELDAALAARGCWSGELRQHTRDARELVVESAMGILREEGRSLVLATNHDVTDRKRLELALQKQVSELAAADRSKNEFVALLAHELRNPLAPLRNAIHVLGRTASSDEPTRRARELIERQVGTMSRLVDDLLDAARINRGQVQLEMRVVELQTIIRQAVEATRAMMEERRHRVSIELPPEPIRLEADPMRLEQVFTNLLTNAAKYTPEGGDIRVRAALVPPNGDVPDAPAREVIASVRDSGIGIEPEVLPTVFELFAQADRSHARTRGGLGVGLSVVRSLVELHGGKVLAESEGAGRGSEFRVRLPLAAGAGSAAAAPPAEASQRIEASPAAAARVLVVDDSADVAESTSMILQLAGFSVQTALSGEEALRVAPAFKPDVVLLDIGMPGLDGYAVARRLRSAPELERTVLIAVSGYGSAADRSRSREAGFDLHLVKPVDPSALQRVLGELAR